MDNNNTMMFNVENESEQRAENVLIPVYDALSEKGYNPINQIVGYLMSGDPGYISSHKEARNKILKFERYNISF